MNQECDAHDHTHHVILTLKDGLLNVLAKPEGIRLTLVDYDVEGEMAASDCEDPDPATCTLREWSESELVNAEHDAHPLEQVRSATGEWFCRWKCPDCGLVVRWSYGDLAEAGTPCCTDCDLEMEMI